MSKFYKVVADLRIDFIVEVKDSEGVDDAFEAAKDELPPFLPGSAAFDLYGDDVPLSEEQIEQAKRWVDQVLYLDESEGK